MPIVPPASMRPPLESVPLRLRILACFPSRDTCAARSLIARFRLASRNRAPLVDTLPVMTGHAAAPVIERSAAAVPVRVKPWFAS